MSHYKIVPINGAFAIMRQINRGNGLVSNCLINIGDNLFKRKSDAMNFLKAHYAVDNPAKIGAFAELSDEQMAILDAVSYGETLDKIAEERDTTTQNVSKIIGRTMRQMHCQTPRELIRKYEAWLNG
jgi:DNA-binding NarL/FixJ family response regulator